MVLDPKNTKFHKEKGGELSECKGRVKQLEELKKKKSEYVCIRHIKIQF